MIFLFLIPVFIGFANADGSSCEDQCQNSFPLHTFPKKNSFHACLRGCRLERIEQVSKNWGKVLFMPERNCEKDCGTAYEDDIDSKNACAIGCKAAGPALPTKETMLKEERSKAGFDDSNQFFILRPVLVVRRYCSGLYSVAVSYIGKRETFASQDGYSHSIAVEVMEQPKYFQLESVASVSYPKKHGREANKFDVQEPNKEDTTWLGCVSYKAGLPKWLLSTALVVSVSAMVYLFLSIFYESENEKIHSFDNAIDSDADDAFIKPLLIEVDQAPALPPKYSEKGGIL